MKDSKMKDAKMKTQDVPNLHSEDEDEVTDLHLEDEKMKDEMEDARSRDEEATPIYITPISTKVKRNPKRLNKD